MGDSGHSNKPGNSRPLAEPPKAADAPSNLAIIGRYVLTPDIFPALEETAREKDRTGEIQLTNGLRRLLNAGYNGPLILHGLTESQVDDSVAFLKAKIENALNNHRGTEAQRRQ